MQEFNEFYEEPKVPTSVKVISILEFVFNGFGLLGVIAGLFLKDFINSAIANAGGTQVTTTGDYLLALLTIIMVVVGCILILKKNKIGFFLYLAGYAVSIILNIINGQFSALSIVGLILPILMTIFVLKNKEFIGL